MTDERAMTFDEITKKIQEAGCSWAVSGDPDGYYLAYVEFGKGKYVADGLATALGAEEGSTPAEALEKAFVNVVAT